MKFCIITQVEHYENGEALYSYAPYVREMNIWLKYVDQVILVAPVSSEKPGKIDLQYDKKSIDFRQVPAFSLTSVTEFLKIILNLLGILMTVYHAMKQADHIHLRCPGNMGLLGALVQILFPQKRKTTKYAGNWDPKTKQPWSYRLQKWILSNTFLTKNMKVLVYGDWPNQSKNIKSFFTATYYEKDKTTVPQRRYDLPLRFLFVGGLVPGKQPDYALKLVAGLIEQGFPSEIHYYGDGPESESLTALSQELTIQSQVFFHGNQSAERVKEAYQKSHFLILGSKSEGWPKVIAEAMWWGVIPIATPVSCVPWMLDYEKRGILLETRLEGDIFKLAALFKSKPKLRELSNMASEWSRMYTLDRFDNEIKKLL